MALEDSLNAIVLWEIHARKGMTADDVAGVFGFTPAATAARLAALADAGLIRPFTLEVAGRPLTTWFAVSVGRESRKPVIAAAPAPAPTASEPAPEPGPEPVAVPAPAPEPTVPEPAASLELLPPPPPPPPLPAIETSAVVEALEDADVVPDEVESEAESEDGEVGDDDETDEGAAGAGQLVGDRSSPLVMDLDEAAYNARDVLSMCRIYPLIAVDLERTDTVQVYDTDRQLASIALQMTRTGLPVDVEEKDRIGTHLREIAATAKVTLRGIVDGNRDGFVEHVARLQAAKARKSDPDQGKPTTVTYKLDAKGKPEKDAEGNKIILSQGPPHSAESAYAARKVIRAEAFRKALDAANWQETKKGVNFTAKIQQAAILMQAGVPLIARTEKTGLPKIDKEILDEQAHHPAARAMLQYTLAMAVVRNFIDNLQLGPDGRMHPEWIIHKISGRWGSKPNVQNWTVRAGGGAENIRRMIAAPAGFKLVSADAAQLEARLIAADSQDPFLLDVFKQGKDIHGEIAGVVFAEWPTLAKIFAEHKKQLCGLPPKCTKCGAAEFDDKGRCLGCNYDNETKCSVCQRRNKTRDVVKRLEYGGFYGGEPPTLFAAVHKDFPDFPMSGVYQFLEMFNSKMSRVVEWRAENLNRALKEHEIRSPILGRRQVFPMGRVDPSVVYNWRPQSGGADLWALGALAFCSKWDQEAQADVRLNHNGHDSVMILTRDDLVDEVAKDIHACWEREWQGVPFLMEVKSGQRWSG